MNKKLLIIVDMQNDFITGSLANKDAKKTVPMICELISFWDGDIFATLDTHYDNYLSTQEGIDLPIKHCIKNTQGHRLDEKISNAICLHKKNHIDNRYEFIEKSSFGYDSWDKLHLENYQEITFVGTRTEICVISNVLAIRLSYPNIKIKVIEKLCSGNSKKDHKTAIVKMKANSIDIV